MLHKKQRVWSLFCNVVISVYMVLILAVMPFYFTNGYGRIGTDKYEFFRGITVSAGGIILPLVVISLGIKWAEVIKNPQLCREERRKLLLGPVSSTDIFAMLYGAALIFSWLYSEYRESGDYGSAWTGARGWYMGLSTQLLFLGLYFGVSRLWRPNKWLPALWIPVTFVVYVLGYCDFLSTVGNINWYCGYMVTVFFGILYYWWRTTEERSWVTGMLAVYCVTGFGALITQGSNSGFLTLTVMCLSFFVLSAKCGVRMQRFWLTAVCLGCAATITYGLRSFFPGRFKFPDALVELVTNTPAAGLLLVVSLCAYGCVKYWNDHDMYPGAFLIRFAKLLTSLLMGLLGLFVFAIVINTLFPGNFGKVSEWSILTFNEKWGSLRGATWIAGIRCWTAQSFAGKLLGVGPDCMANYIYSGSDPELLDMVQREFEGKILTNAHCEWLTILVNVGLLGAVAFGGMMISAIRRYLKCGKGNILAGACGMGLLAYTVHNVVSFQQTMATATMFLVLGMGEAFLRQQEGVNDEESTKK